MTGTGGDKVSRYLTSFQLKLIAAVSMSLDHFAAVVLYALINRTVTAGGDVTALIHLYDILRYIGRLAFPIYCFLLTEGFCHTRSVFRYSLRLGLFALLSEIPFDLALNAQMLELYQNNVFFTLLVGLGTMWAIREGKNLLIKHSGKVAGLLGVLWTALMAALGYILAELLWCDYGGAGVLAITAMYLLRDRPVAGFLAGVGVLSLGNTIELYALPAALPVACYRGDRGRGGKWWFYLFYPAHLLVFWFVARLAA